MQSIKLSTVGYYHIKTALLQIAIQADDFLFKKLLEAEYSIH